MNIRMSASWKHLKEHAGFSWEKGFLIIAYFLFISVLNALFSSDWLFIIFAWPFYILPRHAFLAATITWLYAYLIATMLLLLLRSSPLRKK